MTNNFDGVDPQSVERIYLIDAGAVFNFIVATPEFVLTQYGQIEAAFISRLLPSQPDIGWSWTPSGGFTPPSES